MFFGVLVNSHLFWSHRITQYVRCALKQYFYMIGRDESGAVHRVLKISRLEPSELNIVEDSATYSKAARDELLQRIHHGNLSTGGLEFVTVCYGIVGTSLTSN